MKFPKSSHKLHTVGGHKHTRCLSAADCIIHYLPDKSWRSWHRRMHGSANTIPTAAFCIICLSDFRILFLMSYIADINRKLVTCRIVTYAFSAICSFKNVLPHKEVEEASFMANATSIDCVRLDVDVQESTLAFLERRCKISHLWIGYNGSQRLTSKEKFIFGIPICVYSWEVQRQIW